MKDPMLRVRMDCNVMMNSANFNNERRRLWKIWAAKWQCCTECDAEPYEPCLNQNEANKGNKVACRWPHASRVDWGKLYEGLVQRGFLKRG